MLFLRGIRLSGVAAIWTAELISLHPESSFVPSWNANVLANGATVPCLYARGGMVLHASRCIGKTKMTGPQPFMSIYTTEQSPSKWAPPEELDLCM
jgi:hypothetical protein